MNVWAIGWVAFAVVWAITFGSRAAWLAGGRRRHRGRWFLFGAVLGPAGLLILDDAPPGTCASCLGPVTGWSMICETCGEDVRTNPRVAHLLGTTPRVEPPSPFRPERFTTGVAVGPGRPDAAPRTDAPASLGMGQATSPAGSPARRRRAAPPLTVTTAVEPVVGAPRAPAPEIVTPTRPQTTPRRSPEPATRDTAPVSVRPASVPDAPLPVALPSAPHAVADQQLEELRRPIRLASCVFVEGSVGLLPGLWYDLTSEGGTITITGQPGSIPNATALSRPLSDVVVRIRGDQLVVTGVSDDDERLQLVFESTRDWTPLGVAREIDVRREALRAG